MVCRKTVLALLFASVALAVSCSSSGQPAPSPGATTGASPTATAGGDRPSILEGAEVVQLQQGSERHIPGKVTLFIETGCWQCDGPTEGLLWVSTLADGSPVVETIFDPATLGTRPVTTPKGVEEEEPYITGFAVGADGAEIVVSVCVRESCGSGGLDAWSRGSQTLLLRSTDGGVTWERWGEVDVGGFVISLAAPGRAIVGTWEAENQPAQFAYFPGLVPLPAPARDAWPLAVTDVGVLWRSPDFGALLGPDGRTLIDFGPGEILDVAPAREEGGPGHIVAWNWLEGGQRYHYYLTVLDSGGRVQKTYEHAGFMMLSPQGLEKGLAIGNADIDPSRLTEPAPELVFNYLPVLFDLTEGTVSPILEPFAAPAFPRGRNQVVGVRREIAP